MFRSRRFHGGGACTGLGARRFTFKSAVRQVMRDISTNQFMVRAENLLRAVVRQELGRLIQTLLRSSQRSSSNLTETSRSETPLQLRFVNSLPKAIFTASRIKAEDGSAIMLELIDSNTKTRVTSGPCASSRVEIVALNGDFTQENWDGEQFEANIVREREGRRPLTTGDLIVMLQQGVGSIAGDVVFTDNSSWTRSGRFRLGARVLRKKCFETRVREAKSEAFVCRDQRGEPHRKHYPPFPGDEVWRLVKIAKDGVFHSRLAKFRINTVKDFLRRYIIDPIMLRKILGDGAAISNRVWEAITAHSLRCVLDESEYYVYDGVGHRGRLLLNSIYKVEAVSFEDHGFQPADKLIFGQKLVLNELKHEAYRNTNGLLRVNGHAFNGPPSSLPSPQDRPFSLPESDQPGSLRNFNHGVQPERLLNFDQSLACTSYSCGMVTGHQVQPNGHPFQVCSPALRNSFRMGECIPVAAYVGENSRSCPEGQIVGKGQLENDNIAHPRLFSTHWSPGSTSWAQANALNLFSDTVSEVVNIFPDIDVHIAGIDRSKAGWCKIRAALKLRSVWRFVVARNRARPSYTNY